MIVKLLIVVSVVLGGKVPSILVCKGRKVLTLLVENDLLFVHSILTSCLVFTSTYFQTVYQFPLLLTNLRLIMVFTAAQTTAFFEDDDQMALAHATRLRLQAEGLTTVDDLIVFEDEEALKQLIENLRKPSGTIPNPNGVAGEVIPTPSFAFGAKSKMRITAAINIVIYYNAVGRDLTVQNMRWEPTIRNFSKAWKSLTSRKEKDPPETPKISKSLVVMKWAEAFPDFLHRVVGARTIPLNYVIRPTVAVGAAPALLPNQPYCEDHGSVEEELIARANHTDPLFRDDNASVYYFIEEATRGTQYVASIKPYQRAKDGRGAWIAITSQYAGEDKWEAEWKKQDDLLHTRKWKGQSNFSLEKFVTQHRNAYTSMQQCATHLTMQLPNEGARVKFLLDAIECPYAPLQAAMALVRNDKGETGKRNDFEATASFILPHDPVAKKREDSKRPHADISSTDVSGSSPGKGKSSGVELRYHTRDEYKKLTTEQRNELREWRSNTTGGKASKKQKNKADSASTMSDQKKFKKMVSEAIATELSNIEKEKDKKQAEKDDAASAAYILSLVQADRSKAASKPAAKAASAATSASKASAPAALHSILKRACFADDKD